MTEEKHVHGVSYVLYYIVLFFAYWFGASRFDMDGDGDFDPEDVQAYLADKGFLTKNFKQSRTARARMKKEKRKKELEEKQKAKEALHSGEAGPPEGGEGTGSADVEDFVTSKVDGPASEDLMMQNLIEKQRIPWFITFECLVVFGLWFGFAVKAATETGADPLQVKAGLDSLADGMTDLRWAGPSCEDYRPQAWRWLSYQFTHVGAMHVLMNIFLCLMLGIPLEGLHGSLRMFVMFNFGVLGGAACYFMSDAHTAVVGCSGGCYALIGIHFADLIMNWRQKKFRLPTVFFLILLAGVDLFSYMMSLSAENTSNAAHFGGCLAGVIIGVLVCKNLRMYWHEKVLMAIMFLFGAGLGVASLYWIFSAENGPINLFEEFGGENGYCWVKQTYLPSVDETQWLCVRCGNQDCIDKWSAEPYLEDVATSVCEEKGWYEDGR